MTVADKKVLVTPYFRVGDKDSNITFFQEMLGFYLQAEENALAFFGGHGADQRRFTIEESPASRTRAVEGPKKAQTTHIRASFAEDIEQLLARGHQVQAVYKGQKGYAFRVLSPQGDAFLLHAEDDVSCLQVVERPEVAVDPAFKGLRDFEVSGLVLNVPDPDQSRQFYEAILGLDLPLELTFLATAGADLMTEPHQVWDLEALEVTVPVTYDLAALADQLTAKGQSVFLNRKASLLVVSDPSQIELWLTK